MQDKKNLGAPMSQQSGLYAHGSIPRRSVLGGLGAAGVLLGVGGSGLLRAANAAPATLIDVHRHITAPKLRTLMAAQGRTVPALDNDTAEIMLAEMNKVGIARSILTLVTPPAQLKSTREEWVAIARDANETMARRVADHPGRFGFFAQLPMPYVDDTLAEIAYALDTLKADGVQFSTSYGSHWMGDPEFAPIYAELDRRKTVVYTHPLEAACCAANVTDVPATTVEYGADTARTVSRWLLSGSAARYQNINPIFSHAGGLMLGMLERLALLAVQPTYKDKLPLGLDHELRRCYYDTAQAWHPATLRGLRTVVPVSQILFGTDYPYRGAQETWDGVRHGGVFSATELRAIGFGNARRLLRMPV